MKLRNKKTGEIMQLSVKCENGGELKTFDSNTNTDRPITLAELNEEWCDYEEPKRHWIIDTMNDRVEDFDVPMTFNESIGNYFETKEEAEKAVEKLKAWKRLKDKGFKVDLWDYDGGNYQERIKTGRILFRVKEYEENDKDLDLLFGGEE